MNGIHRLNTMGAQVKTTKAGKSQRRVVWSKIWHGNKTMSFALDHLCMPSLALIWPHYYSLCSMNGFCKLCHLTQAINQWVSVRSLIQGACAWPSPAKGINGQHGMYCSIYGKQCASVDSRFSRHLYRWLCLWLHKSETIFVELLEARVQICFTTRRKHFFTSPQLLVIHLLQWKNQWLSKRLQFPLVSFSPWIPLFFVILSCFSTTSVLFSFPFAPGGWGLIPQSNPPSFSPCSDNHTEGLGVLQVFHCFPSESQLDSIIKTWRALF